MMYYFYTMGIIHHFFAQEFQGFETKKDIEKELTSRLSRVNITHNKK